MMATKIAGWAVVMVVCSSAGTWADKAAPIEKAGVRLTPPKAWNRNVKGEALLERLTPNTSVIAYGLPTELLRFTLSVFRSPKTTPGVRVALDAHHARVKSTVESAKYRVDTHKYSETPTRSTVEMEAKVEDTVLRGLTVAMVDKDGYLRTFTLQCTFDEKQGAKAKERAQCDEAIKSVEILLADKNLRPLEPKGK